MASVVASPNEDSEHRASDLQHDLRLLEKLSSDALRAMADTQKEMSQV